MSKFYAESTYDSILQTEGLLAYAEAKTTKRVVAQQIEQDMRKSKLSKASLAHMMGTSRSALDRLLDPGNK